MADGTEEWLTTQGAMEVLGVSRTRLWQLTKAGLLTAHQRGVNRKVRYYRRAEVERLAHEARPVPAAHASEQQEGLHHAGRDLLPGQR